ncbi:extracellular solute-binding protein [Paenibacillus sp. GCM10023248]|uniref:extracellular solute-binding protein n=1 Tax=Bacillales TaxID=1385 RepID=UPI002377E3FE|nr:MULTISPECIES: extracellular solute-binding protein [Bacillales]MDD9265449.1 extracellular solute-binding protein [Paenibacillus sp. MAHUQ-63]MDR6882518.1 putative aldouronate transport system substrate-binding protein [Bacillus sp. 3255]
MLGKKVFASGLAAILLAAVVTGCSSTPINASGVAFETADTENKAPVTFSYYLFAQGTKDVLASETTIGKELQKQTGVDFKLQYLVGDSATKAGVMIASGDYPDVISSSGEMAKLMDAGAYIALDDLIEKYGPNIKRVYGPYFNMMKAKDGKIYTLPFTANQGYTAEPDIGGGAFWIQRSVLKEFGYPRITTIDEYFDLIKKYKGKNPKVDGKDTIGFMISAGVTNNFFTLQNPAMHLAGYPNDGSVTVDMKTNEAKLVAGTDNQKRWMKKLNEMYAIGLFDPESLTMNKDQYLAKLTSGRVLGYFNYGWQVAEATKKLKAAGIDEKRYAPLPIVFDKGIKDQYIDPPGFVNNYGIGITVKAKDPVRIIKYFDNMLQEENQILVSWGMKDQTYSVDEKGRYYYKDDQSKYHEDPELSRTFGFTYYGNDWPRYGYNSVLKDGNAFAPGNQSEVVSKLYTEGDKKILDTYGAKTFSDYFSKPEERKWFPAWSISIPQGSPEQIFTTRSDDLQKKYLSKMILESPDKFESIWNAYINELNKLDKQGYEGTITNAVKDRVAGKW